MDFNKRIASNILEDLRHAKASKISLEELEHRIEAYIVALDSTFPKKLKKSLDELDSEIEDLKIENYAGNLNTENEGSYSGKVRQDAFGNLITSLEAFINE